MAREKAGMRETVAISLSRRKKATSYYEAEIFEEIKQSR